MEGKKKEKKLVVKDGMKADRKRVIKALEGFQDGVTVCFDDNQFYRDEYFDDKQNTLLKEGGSLKLRTGTRSAISANKSIVMRRRTTDPRKLKITIWDEVEVPAYQSQDLLETLKPMKPFFPNFDFTKLIREPVLICSTSRSIYCLLKDEIVIAKIYMDSIKYEAGNKFSSDEIIKVRVGEKAKEDEIYACLIKSLPEYQSIEASRYERALERLSKISE